MPSSRRVAKPALVLLALAVLGLVLAACALFKPGSLKLSQPAGIGSVRVHFEICAEPGEAEGPCKANQTEGEGQIAVGIAVPKGASAPSTFTAVPTVGGGAPIVFTRNNQAGQELSSSSGAFEEEPWPPAGSEGIGYLSSPFTEAKEVLREWSVDGDFGLPASADPFTGPFKTAVAYGYRSVGGESGSADRPLDCAFTPEELTPETATCSPSESAELGTSDLRIGAPSETPVYVGGAATVAFPMNFASTATALPSFNLGSTSTLSGAGLALSAPTFAPGPPAADTHRSPADSRSVNVTVPKTAQPGTYDVTLTATTAQGAAVSQVGKLIVTKPTLKFGKVKLNKKKGTALLSVTVPSAGKVAVTGKGMATAKRTAKGPTTLKLPIKAKGKTKKKLTKSGKAKVKADVTFTPTSGVPVSKARKISLKKNAG